MSVLTVRSFSFDWLKKGENVYNTNYTRYYAKRKPFSKPYRSRYSAAVTLQKLATILNVIDLSSIRGIEMNEQAPLTIY